jgi:hypothetical protein
MLHSVTIHNSPMSARRFCVEKSEGNAVGNQVLGWVDLAMDAVEVAALIVVLVLLFHVHRTITALVRVIRRMDRKMVDPTIDRYSDKPS